MLWGLGDPVDARGWETDQTRMIERLLPHVRQFLLVRQALVEAGELGESLAGLLDTAGTGVIHLDRRGRIVAANDLVVEATPGDYGTEVRSARCPPLHRRSRRCGDDSRMCSGVNDLAVSRVDRRISWSGHGSGPTQRETVGQWSQMREA